MASTKIKVKKQCTKCRSSMDEELNFYKNKDGTRDDICKKCLAMHVDPFNEDTFLWILKKKDLPYVKIEWVKARTKAYNKNPDRMGVVLGNYLGTMRLNQYKDCSWEDSDELNKEYNKLEQENETHKEEIKKANELLKEKLDNGEITEAEYQTLITPEQEAENQQNPAPYSPSSLVGENNFYKEENYMSEADFDNLTSADLTEEDKIYLALKWGRLYKETEWIQLEKLYEEFIHSFGVQGAARLDTLKKICKTSLKMDQAIDMGDIEGYQKLSRVYDALMKSGKFTEAQRKEEKNQEFDCVGVLVNFAESVKGGGRIERHKITYPLDKIDQTITKLQNYYNTIIRNDPNIYQEIKNYIQKRENLQSMNESAKIAKEMGVEKYELTDEDYISSRSIVEEEIEKDAEIQRGAYF